MAYARIQSILEEAGMSHNQPQEVPSGTIDGSNKAFTVAHTPLTDSNYDDVVDTNDVFVLVNGNPANVSSVDTAHGIIELSAAPPEGAELLITYRYSPVSLQFATDLLAEAAAWINKAMRNIDPAVPYDTGIDDPANIDATVRSMTRIWCAAMLLTRDYGFNQDTEQTSKDGFQKLKVAQSMLADFKNAGGVEGGDDGGDTDEAQLEAFQVQSDKDTDGHDLFPSTFRHDEHKFDDRATGPGFNEM